MSAIRISALAQLPKGLTHSRAVSSSSRGGKMAKRIDATRFGSSSKEFPTQVIHHMVANAWARDVYPFRVPRVDDDGELLETWVLLKLVETIDCGLEVLCLGATVETEGFEKRPRGHRPMKRCCRDGQFRHSEGGRMKTVVGWSPSGWVLHHYSPPDDRLERFVAKLDYYSKAKLCTGMVRGAEKAG